MPLTHDHDELCAWLTLTLTEGVGPVTARELLGAFGQPQEVLDAPASSLAQIAGAAVAQRLKESDTARGAAVDAALAWVNQPNNTILTLADVQYPQALLQAPDPPVLLYIKGDLALLNRPAVAIVGSRNATAQGLANAEQFARALSNAGITIISGLALGIDGAAHRGALDGAGSTIAITGTGQDIVYPSKHRDLAHEIARRGLILSEFSLGTKPLSGHFPRRNRLIAGLARGVLVVEAATQSGSLITARLAGDLGREVLAIPGSIHSPQSRGCHLLIKQGAKLVESAQDVIEELRMDAAAPLTQAPRAPSALEQELAALLDALGYEPTDLDTLALRTGLPTQHLLAELTALELEGGVARLPAGRWQRL
ncbi:MAG: DNA-processing protein DprA [Burkholderiaceae bacterium]